MIKQTIPEFNPHHCTGCRGICGKCTDRHIFYYDMVWTAKKRFFFFKGKPEVTSHEGFGLYSVDKYIDEFKHKLEESNE